jgi:hypothetical protein
MRLRPPTYATQSQKIFHSTNGLRMKKNLIMLRSHPSLDNRKRKLKCSKATLLTTKANLRNSIFQTSKISYLTSKTTWTSIKSLMTLKKIVICRAITHRRDQIRALAPNKMTMKKQRLTACSVQFLIYKLD